MKKYFLIIFASAFIVGCNSQMDKAMKSADKDFILQAANDQFAKKKWANAIQLYERLTNLVAGTDDAANVVFNSAYANYYDKNYKLAGHQFKNFSVTFPQDPRKEEAAYMSAICYYNGSMDYNLDQSSTDLAITELQNFLNEYPESERSKNIGQMIDELSYKQEFKAYENARQYYKMGDYKAANVALENVLDDFPATKLRPNIYDYIMRSRFELAKHSIYDLKQERIDNAIAYSKFVEKELPGTDFAKDAAKMREDLHAEDKNFAQVRAQTEARRAELEARQQRLADQAKIREGEAAERSQRQSQIDSAVVVTPPPAVSIPIQK